MSDSTSIRPDPQATAWMRDFLVDRPFVDPIEICDHYREAHPDTALSNKVLTESYVAAREPHDDEACTGDEDCECPCLDCRDAIRDLRECDVSEQPCGAPTPDGPCGLRADHPVGAEYPGHNGHVSEAVMNRLDPPEATVMFGSVELRRCQTCRALTTPEDAPDHLTWHQRLHRALTPGPFIGGVRGTASLCDDETV